MRETGRYLFFFPPTRWRSHDAQTREKQILVAGVGNIWLRDDGFGGEVAKRLEARELPDGVTVLDFGTGGLDLAYEVMRGYDGLVLVDVSRQGGEPGTLYVMEATRTTSRAASRTATMIDPHGMDPQTVLRFVKASAAGRARWSWSPASRREVEEMGIGLTEPAARRRRSRRAAPSTAASAETDRRHPLRRA